MAKAPRDPVQFTYESAERIANVVRAAETSAGPAAPLRFDRRAVQHPQFGQPSAIRSATFSGSWARGSSKTVAFAYMTGTAIASNDLMSLPDAGTRNCIVGKEGTAWRLINWQWDTAYAATSATLTTSSLQFNTLPVGVVATSSSVTFSIVASACTT